jgi:hypothetical protein
MVFRAGLDYMENWAFVTLPGLELPPLCSPARRHSLYRLLYRGSYNTSTKITYSFYLGLVQILNWSTRGQQMRSVFQHLQTLLYFCHGLYLFVSHEWLWQVTANISVQCIKRSLFLLDMQLFLRGKNLIFKCNLIDCNASNNSKKSKVATVLKLRRRYTGALWKYLWPNTDPQTEEFTVTEKETATTVLLPPPITSLLLFVSCSDTTKIIVNFLHRRRLHMMQIKHSV